jgi:hypothetical protein
MEKLILFRTPWKSVVQMEKSKLIVTMLGLFLESTLSVKAKALQMVVKKSSLMVTVSKLI